MSDEASAKKKPKREYDEFGQLKPKWEELKAREFKVCLCSCSFTKVPPLAGRSRVESRQICRHQQDNTLSRNRRLLLRRV